MSLYGMVNALACRIADDAVNGKLPSSIVCDLYAEYKAEAERQRNEPQVTP